MRKFLEESPLYAWVPLSYPRARDDVESPGIEIHCERCGCSRPFLPVQRSRVPAITVPDPRFRPDLIAEGDLLTFVYFCSGPGCGQRLDFIVEFSLKPQRLRKVGQRPPMSVDIPRDLATALGPDDSALFRKAKVTLAQGYGIGACAYLRRMLEHQVNPILSLVLEARRYEGAPEEELAKIRKTVEGKAGDEKMRLAYQHAPRSLVVEGSNPLKLLYEFLSVAIHTLPEDEAAKMARAIDAALVITLRELGRAKAEREAYTRAIRDLGKQPA
jgi:hypothetical protein